MLLELCCVARGKGCHRVKHGHTLERFHPVDTSTLSSNNGACAWHHPVWWNRHGSGQTIHMSGNKGCRFLRNNWFPFPHPYSPTNETFFGQVKIWRLWRQQLSPPTGTADSKDLRDHVWNFWNPVIKSKSCVGSMWRESKSSGTKRACALH